jgi:hypothetical protein
MADDKRQEAKERLKKFGAMSLDDVAVEAALNPGLSAHSQVAEVEIRRRVVQGRWSASQQRRTLRVLDV